MLEFWGNLFESAGFMPQGNCYFWQPDVLGTNALGDGLTALAFFSIPPALLYFRRRRRDLAHNYVFTLFALFIFLCGATHLTDLLTIWKPFYRFQGVLKLTTGLISLGTAVVLYRNLPHWLAFPSHSSLGEVNTKLRAEVTERESAQDALREANRTLEARVHQRTSQLIDINRELENEIRERKRTEEELKEKNLELQRINADLDDLLYCASTDLKAPILNIEGLVSALKEEIPLPSHQVNEILHLLDGSLLKADRTVLDLTDVSNLQKNGSVQEKAELNLADVLEAVKAEMADLISMTGATVVADFSEAPVVKLGLQDLKKILFNLLSNAIKYQKPGKIPVIAFKSETEGNQVVLRVTDNGPGIAPLPKEAQIFSPGRRLSGNGAGAGIGLFLVKMLLDSYGGQIKVNSTPGEGSVFELIFPEN